MSEQERLYAWDRAVAFVRSYDRIGAPGEYFGEEHVGLNPFEVSLLMKYGYLEFENGRIRPSPAAITADFADRSLDEITMLIEGVGSPERFLERIGSIRTFDIPVSERLPLLVSEGWVRNGQDGYVLTDEGVRNLETVIVNYVMRTSGPRRI